MRKFREVEINNESIDVEEFARYSKNGNRRFQFQKPKRFFRESKHDREKRVLTLREFYDIMSKSEVSPFD